jgi:hypothetical protein
MRLILISHRGTETPRITILSLPLGVSVASFVVLALVLGCGGGGAAASPEATEQVRGRVVEVVTRNITEVETLRIRDESGRLWAFTTEAFAGFTPSHLREHQLFGQSVVVSYVKKDSQLVAVNITD